MNINGRTIKISGKMEVSEELQLGQHLRIVIDVICVKSEMGDNNDGTLWVNHVLKAEEGRAEVERP